MNQVDIYRHVPARQVVPRGIAMFCYPDAQVIDITGPLSVFATAADFLSAGTADPPAYSVTLLATDAAPVETSCGVRVVPDRHYGECDLSQVDTLIVAGG